MRADFKLPEQPSITIEGVGNATSPWTVFKGAAEMLALVHFYDFWGDPLPGLVIECERPGSATRIHEVTEILSINYDYKGHPVAVNTNLRLLYLSTTISQDQDGRHMTRIKTSTNDFPIAEYLAFREELFKGQQPTKPTPGPQQG